MLSATIQKLQTTSTKRILTVLIDAKEEIKEAPPTDESISRHEEVHIPLEPRAKDIIRKLLASNIYTLSNVTTESKAFSIKFSSTHPSVVTLDEVPQAFHEVFTHIDAQGNIKYQIQAFDGTLHYIKPERIPYSELRNNHLNIVAPHLEAMAEEEHSKSSGTEISLQPRKAF